MLAANLFADFALKCLILSPARSKLKCMKNPLFWRLILAISAGIIVAGLCFDNISKGAATVYYARYPQQRTRQAFTKIQTKIAQFQQKNARLPASIAELDFGWQGTPPAQRQIFDGWRNPIIYQVRDGKPRLLSLGADRKIGGMGVEHDLTSDNPNPPAAKLSRLENLRHPLSRGMASAALVCGFLVTIFTFAGINRESLRRENWIATAFGLFLTLIAASLVSLVITAFHVPSGH